MEVAFDHRLLNLTVKEVAPLDLRIYWRSRTNDLRERNVHLTQKLQYHVSVFYHIPRGQIEEHETPTPALDVHSWTTTVPNRIWVISWLPVRQLLQMYLLELKESINVPWALDRKVEKPFLSHRSSSPVRRVVKSAKSRFDYDLKAVRWRLQPCSKRSHRGDQDASDRRGHIPEPILSTVKSPWIFNTTF